MLPVADSKTGIRIDFIFSLSEYEKQAIARAVEFQLGKDRVKFASLEDLVIHKIIASRPRDLEDVELILLKNPHYDAGYIIQWLNNFDESLETNYLEIFQSIVEKTF